MLGNTIALLTLALMLASEGRQTTGLWRAGLFTVATVVALLAVALGPITDKLPLVGATLSAVFDQPLAWFVLLIALFFVLRPLWSRMRPSPPPAPQIAEGLSEERVVALIQQHSPASPVVPAELDGLNQKVNELAQRDTVSRELRMTSHAIALAEQVAVLELVEARIAELWAAMTAPENYVDWNNRFIRLQERLKEMSRRVTDAIGTEIDLKRAPNFNNNPDRPVPGDEALGGSGRQDYRFAYDQVHNARRILRSLVDERRREIDSAANPLKTLLKYFSE